MAYVGHLLVDDAGAWSSSTPVSSLFTTDRYRSRKVSSTVCRQPVLTEPGFRPKSAEEVDAWLAQCDAEFDAEFNERLAAQEQ
jgi:hypothetical protein